MHSCSVVSLTHRFSQTGTETDHTTIYITRLLYFGTCGGGLRIKGITKIRVNLYAKDENNTKGKSYNTCQEGHFEAM
jgi:hypothetical protein